MIFDEKTSAASIRLSASQSARHLAACLLVCPPELSLEDSVSWRPLLSTPVFMMRGELDCEFRSDVDYVALAKRWIERALEEVCLEELQQILSGPSLDPNSIRREGAPCGTPGSLWGFCSVTARGTRGERSASRVISSKNLAWLVEKISAEALSVTVAISNLGADGYPQIRLARVAIDRELGADSWVRFSFEFPDFRLNSEKYQQNFLRFVKARAAEINPSFGHVAYRYTLGKTAMEVVLGPPWLLPEDTLRESRTYLRGYDWITVCPAELAARLNVQSLLNSGAFCEVQELENGGIWLQATPRIAEYDLDHVRMAWQELSSLLRPGVPMRRDEKSGRPPLPVIYEDARFASDNHPNE